MPGSCPSCGLRAPPFAQVTERAADLPGVLATEQLTEFLSVVADRPGGPAAQHAAVHCVAQALAADVAALMIDGVVVTAVGAAIEDVSAYALGEVVAGRRAGLEVAGHAHAV